MVEPSTPVLEANEPRHLPDRKPLAFLAFLLLGFLLLFLRTRLWPVHTSDLDLAFLPWQDYLIAHGRLLALRHPFGDYFPSYFELAATLSLLDKWLPRIDQIKLLTFCFDIVAAAVAFLLCRALDTSRSKPKTWLAQFAAPLVVLAGPTVILNGAVWGQNDIVYTTCLLVTIYFLVRDKGAWASLAYGFAFAFKLQSIFFAPCYLVFVLRRRVPLWSLLLLPVGWLVALLPVVLVGGSAREFIMLPFLQTHELNALAINMANPWAMANFFHFPIQLGVQIGLALTVVVTLLIAYYGARKRSMPPGDIASLAAATLLVMPYIMPKMHDRYFFPAEVLLSILACVDLAYLLPAILVIAASLLSYAGYFSASTHHPLTAVGLACTSTALFIVIRKIVGRSRSCDRPLASSGAATPS